MARRRINQMWPVTHKPSKERKADQLLDDAKRLLAGFPDKTRDMDFMIDVAGTMINAKGLHNNRDDDEEGEVPSEFGELHDKFIEALENYAIPRYLTEAVEKHGFTPMDLRIILVLAAVNLGLGSSIRDIEDVQSLLCSSNQERLDLAKHLLPEGRLVMSRVVEVDFYRESFKDSNIRIAESFVKPLLRGEGRFSVGWDVANQEELLDKLPIIRRCFSDCTNDVADDESATSSEIRTRDRFMDTFQASIHPDWPLAVIFSDKFRKVERYIMLTLLCKAKCMDSSRFGRENLYTGEGLARAAATTIVDIPKIIRQHLMTKSKLVTDKIIRPTFSGTGDQQTEDEDAVRRLEFELTEEFLKELQIKGKKPKESAGRKPLVKMDSLILADDIREAIRHAISQIANRDLLYNKWGLKEVIPYGQAVTLLFSGPPGIGKTACAEAIADRLGKNIIIADYSQLQNCFVGETEKNIVRLFKTASDSGAVLFFDEADAMFYDRDSADRNWEVRDVNVLLQELEKFRGVCILSTNRKVTLDKALARRISLKLDFKPPTREQARQIWEKMLPKKLPLSDDVDLDELSRTSLTGGEIKNVILNAARRAADQSGPKRSRKVTMADLRWALSHETRGKSFSEEHREMIGFRLPAAVG